MRSHFKASLALIAMALAALSTDPARASDLGTAGPFRSFGSVHCATEDPKALDTDCRPPDVDPTASPKVQAETQIARALRFIDLLKLHDARDALERAIELDPTNRAALTLAARLASTELRGIEVDTDLGRALTAYPDDPFLLGTKAFVERDADEQAQGMADANQAIKLAPEDADLRWIRGTIYAMYHLDPLAFTDFSAALAKEPALGRARMARAEILLHMANYRAAILDVDKVTESAPDISPLQALPIRIEANLKLGDDAAALADLDTLLVKSPVPPSAFGMKQFRELAIKRAGVLVRLKRNTEAAAVIDRLIAGAGLQGILRMQVYLHANGFPNVAITGKRSDSFDTALDACFADRTCGPSIAP